MIRRVDFNGLLAYKVSLVVMEFRCFNSAASIALMAGSMAFALLQPDLCAADPIEFSSSTVPLGVPRAVVQMKDTDSDKFSPSHDAVGGLIDESAMIPSSGGIIITRKPRRDEWNLNTPGENSSFDQNDPFSRDYGQYPNGLLSASSSQPTNNTSALKNSVDRVWGRQPQDDAGMFHHFDNPIYGSAQGFDALSSRSSADNQRDGSQSREPSRFNRDGANQGDGSFWNKIFNHEPGAAPHFAFSKSDSSEQADPEPASAFADRYKPTAAAGLGNGSEPAGDSLTRSIGSGTFNTPNEWHSSREGGQNSAIPGFAAPQDPSKPQHWASRSFFTKPTESRASRYGVPERPSVLVMPKRPNDP